MNAVEQLYSADIGEIVLDLPFPPSTNTIWRWGKKKHNGGVHRSAKYVRWMENADATVMAAKQYPRHKIVGPFEVCLLFDEQAGTGDLDNRIKATLDWLVSRDVISDDKHCRTLMAQWVKHERAPKGCQVWLRSLHG